ncbi:unnamed protein product [Dicrocoelium dendriticum]|nr:unnamed protein product [Dicrocoelium dendriticum]
MFRTTASTERVVSVIKMQTGICSPEVTVYLKQEPDMEDQLRPGLTLLDQGFRGGDEWSPQLVKLFYCTSDYRPENWSVTEALKLLSPAHDPVLCVRLCVSVDSTNEEESLQLNWWIEFDEVLTILSELLEPSSLLPVNGKRHTQLGVWSPPTSSTWTLRTTAPAL